MDDSSALQFAGLFVAVVAALVSLVALTFQVSLFRRTMTSQVYQAMIANSMKIDEILIERPRLRKYIYDEAPIPPTDVTEEELESFIELVVDVVDNLRVQERYIPASARSGWRNFTDDVMRQPAVIELMRKRGHWFSGTLT